MDPALTFEYFDTPNNQIITQNLFGLTKENEDTFSIKQSNEKKHLIIFKKALFNLDNFTENQMLETLKPVINSNSVWKSHALYLIAEYFFDKNEKQKAKDFYNQILNFEKSNESIVIETQKRLNRDFSE